MKNKLACLLMVGMGVSSATAMADSYICEHGGQQREITVVYKNPPAKVPCEVTYTKDGETQSLWRASNLEGYCEEKAQAFVEKQTGWGWRCSSQSATYGDDMHHRSELGDGSDHGHSHESGTTSGGETTPAYGDDTKHRAELGDGGAPEAQTTGSSAEGTTTPAYGDDTKHRAEMGEGSDHSHDGEGSHTH